MGTIKIFDIDGDGKVSEEEFRNKLTDYDVPN